LNYKHYDIYIYILHIVSSMNTTTDDDYDALLLNAIETNEKFEFTVLSNMFNQNKHNRVFVDKLMTYFTMYVKGEFNSDHTIYFLIKICFMDTIENELHCAWLEYLDTTQTKEEQCNILIKILTTSKYVIHKGCTMRYVLTDHIWMQKYYRNLIKYLPKYATGTEYVTYGLFSSMFDKNEWYDISEVMVDVYIELIKDESIHGELIQYMHNILKTSMPYGLDNIAMIDTKQCASAYYIAFILQILFRLVKHYTIEHITENIMNDKNIYEVKDYDIQNLPIFHKLYVTTMWCINLSVTYILKMNYVMCNNNAVSQSLTPHIIVTNITRSKTTLLNVEYAQEMYVRYFDISERFNMDYMLNDILTFVDFAMMKIKSDHVEPIRIDVRKELHKYISSIVGGCDKYCSDPNNAMNKHIRYYAVGIILSHVLDLGFDAYGNLLENIFRYLNEVDFFKWTTLTKAIIHHKEIQLMLIMLLDVYGEDNGQNEDNIAGTLFNLINSSLDMYLHIDTVIQTMGSSLMGILSCKSICSDLMGLIVYTLIIAKTVYKKRLLINEQPELENKLAILICKNVSYDFKNINGDVMTAILSISYDVLAYRLTPSIMPHLVNYIDKLVETLNKIKYDGDNKNNIIKYLTTYEFEEEIPYPDEFIDPITCCEIKNPVILPKTNNIHDKTTIMMQLHHDKKHPYTKELLTETILMEYNNKPENRLILDDFMNKKNIWKENYMASKNE